MFPQTEHDPSSSTQGRTEGECQPGCERTQGFILQERTVGKKRTEQRSQCRSGPCRKSRQ